MANETLLRETLSLTLATYLLPQLIYEALTLVRSRIVEIHLMMNGLRHQHRRDVEVLKKYVLILKGQGLVGWGYHFGNLWVQVLTRYSI